MNNFYKFIAFLISLPARWKGMKFGKNAFIGPGYDWLFVKLKGIELKDNVVVGKNSWLQVIDTGKITINEDTQIGRKALLTAVNEISIGKKCLISYNVSIMDHDHVVDDPAVSPIDSGLTKAEKVIIEDNCFIGAHSFIMKGVKLGKHCAVGANSVVNKSFPAYSVIAGSPAVLIKKLR